jgi:DNA repair exonuclease SbcCD ATPase subunit
MTATATHPRLIGLRAENFKRLVAIDVEIGDGVTRITGKNGNGKTSFLDAIQAAIGGKDMVPSAPLRKGSKKGEVSVVIKGVMVDGNELDLTVTRRFHEGKDSDLTITTPEGIKVRSPQAVLDGLMAKIGFDPLAFTRQKPKEQAAVLQKLAGLDFAKADEIRAKCYAERTSVNRDLARARVVADSLPTFDDAPNEEVSAADAIAAVDALRRKQKSWRDAREEVEEARGEVASLTEQLAAAKENLDGLVKVMDGLDEVTDGEIERASASLTEMEATNRKVRENAAKREAIEKAKQLEKQVVDLTTKIEKIDQGKAERIAAAKLPVEGLGFDDDGVTFNGVPFGEASAAEQLRVSTAVAISLNPSLKLMLIRDGSLLDSDSLAMLEQMAEEADAQVLIEQVTDGEPIGICIVDGSVASVNE